MEEDRADIDPSRIYDVDDLSESPLEAAYNGYVRRKRTFMLICIAILFLVVIFALSKGGLDISFADVLRYLFTFDTDGMGRVVWNIRMVRTIAAVCVGAGLAVCGTSMQCILKNPLASPYTLGLSSAAAFGAAFAIMFLQGGSTNTSSIDFSNPYLVTISAFISSMVATGAILLLTRVTKVSAETLVLAGVAISAIFSAAMNAMQYFADSIQLSNMVSWTFGDLGRATWTWDFVVFAALILASIYFIYHRWSYNAMDAGEETASSLGINTKRLRLEGMIISSLLCSILVSFFGIIAFVGLLGPHIARMLIGADHRYLIPTSMILGALILLVSDTFGRLIIEPAVLPVGILTSMLGGPLFIYLLIRRYRR